MKYLAKRGLLIAALALSGCVTDGSTSGFLGISFGPDPVWYDGYYGPYPGGYWDRYGVFYYPDAGGFYRPDRDGHFRRDRFESAHRFHSNKRPRDNGGKPRPDKRGP